MMKKQIRMMSKVEDMSNWKALVNYLRAYVGWAPLALRDRSSHITKHIRLKAHTQQRLVRLVDGHLFNGFFFVAIGMNALWIAHSTNDRIHGRLQVPPVEEPYWHPHMSRLFSWLFMIELFIRLVALRSQFWRRDDHAWNLFDAFVVGCSVLEAIIAFASVTFLRVLRVFRLVRVVRIFKMLRWFSGLQMMLVSLLACLPVLLWTFCTLGFVIFLFSVLILQGAYAILDPDDREGWESLQENFETVAQAMYTLLMSITGGHSWVQMADELGRAHDLLRVLFVVYIMIMTFGFFNILIGVFVVKSSEVREMDGSLAVQKELDSSNAFVSELTSLLSAHCGDEIDEFLPKESFLLFLQSTEVEMFLQTHSIDVAEAEELYHIIATANHKKVTIEDFVYGCQRMKGVAKAMDVVLLFEEVVSLRNSLSENKDRMNATMRDIKSWQSAYMLEFRSLSALLEETVASQKQTNSAMIP